MPAPAVSTAAADNSFGNSAPAISTEEVAAARTKFASVNAPAGVKRAEIDTIVGAAK